MNFHHLGWSPLFSEAFTRLSAPGQVPARVCFAARDRWRLLLESSERWATVAGRLRHDAGPTGLPVVGDWVAATTTGDGRAVIHRILPRQSTVARREAGSRKGEEESGGEQSIAANVDLALVVCGLDRDFNLRRIERYVTLAYGCGVQPAVVLTKADLCEQVDGRRAETEAVAPGVEVWAVSSVTGDGLGPLRAALAGGRTACLLGSSGAGKSTLVNALLGGHRLRTGDTSATTGKGQHTTTHRELLALPGGGVVIDNPGLREIGLAGDEVGVAGAFGEIDQLADACRFRDCRHELEPGCAVREAVEAGTLPAERLASYHRLRRELHHRAVSQDKGAAAAERQRWKPIMKAIRRMPQDKR